MEIEFVCAGCGESCLICDLETEVTLTHCTECANKRISELENKIERVRRCQRYDYGEFDAPAYPCSDGGLLLYSDVLEALADD